MTSLERAACRVLRRRGCRVQLYQATERPYSAHENFDGSLACHNNNRTVPQEAQKFQTSHPPNPGAPRRAFSQARPQLRDDPRFTVHALRFTVPGSYARTPLADFFSLLLFWYEDQHPGRAFFDHVRKPSGGTAGGSSWKDGSTANLNGPKTIGGVLHRVKGEDSWNLSA